MQVFKITINGLTVAAIPTHCYYVCGAENTELHDAEAKFLATHTDDEPPNHTTQPIDFYHLDLSTLINELSNMGFDTGFALLSFFTNADHDEDYLRFSSATIIYTFKATARERLRTFVTWLHDQTQDEQQSSLHDLYQLFLTTK